MVWVKMWVNCLTHTVTHTTKCVERFKEHRRGGFCLLSGIFASFFCLHALRHEAAHGLCGFVLLLAGGVGVGAECESGIVVAQHTLFWTCHVTKSSLVQNLNQGTFR